VYRCRRRRLLGNHSKVDRGITCAEPSQVNTNKEKTAKPNLRERKDSKIGLSPTGREEKDGFREGGFLWGEGEKDRILF